MKRGAVLLFVLGAAVALASPASADWKTDTGKFRIGYVARADRGGATANFDPVVKAVSAVIGMPVEVVPFLDYPSLIEAQIASRIEYAIYSNRAYGTAALLCKCVEPVAAPVKSGGATGIVAVLLTTNPDVNGPADLEKSRLAWTGEEPAAAMVLLGSETAPLTGEESFAVKTPEIADAIAALRKKKADTMIGWAYSGPSGAILPGTGTVAALDEAEIEHRIVWISRQYRFGPHAVRKDVPAEIRQDLETFLIEKLPSDPELTELMDESFSGSFSAVQDVDYETAVTLASRLKDADMPDVADGSGQ